MGAVKQKKTGGRGNKNAQKNDDLVFGPRDGDRVSKNEGGVGQREGKR